MTEERKDWREHILREGMAYEYCKEFGTHLASLTGSTVCAMVDEIERLRKIVDADQRQKQHVLSEVREALSDPTITGYEQIATGIRDLRSKYEEQEPVFFVHKNYLDPKVNQYLAVEVSVVKLSDYQVPLFTSPSPRKWIRCSDRMPGHDDLVLGYKNYGDGAIDYWICMISTHTGQFIRVPDAKIVDPTHWSDLMAPV